MISTLRSIDSLLNRFDELSNCHTNFLSDFDTNFSDIKNPLRTVARAEDEQRKTATNILLVVNEKDDQIGSIGILEDFHRRIIKSRHLHQPPSYSSNDSTIIHPVSSRTSSVITESNSLSRIPQIRIKPNIFQPLVSTSNNSIIESKVDLTTKTKPKVVPQNSPAPRRYARGKIITFTMETVNRLSKPKMYYHRYQSPDPKPTSKRVPQRSKSYEIIKKQASKCCTLPPIKRAPPPITATKPFPKNLELQSRISIQAAKRTPVSDFSRPLVFLAPPPIIQLTFPMQPQYKQSLIVNLPKITTATRKSMIYLKA